MLYGVIENLLLQLKITDVKIKEYYLYSARKNLAVIKNALKNNCLKSVFVSFQEKSPFSVYFEYGEKLNNELFRKITNEIQQYRFISDKIKILKDEIYTIPDLIDVLESNCLFEEEFDVFLNPLEIWRLLFF